MEGVRMWADWPLRAQQVLGGLLWVLWFEVIYCLSEVI